MRFFKLTLFPLILVLFWGCANNTPVPEPEDDPTNLQEFTGPGLFSGDSGALPINSILGRLTGRNDKDRRRFITVTGSDVDVPAIDLDSFEEFERFKAWRRAQQEGSAEYQDWLDFQEFLKLKKENGS